MRNVVRYLNKQGGIAVIATDTVYGVVARAADPLAVARLYDLKRREGKPGTVIAASVDQLVDMGIDRQYFTAVENLWPGAVSVVIACDQTLSYIHQGTDSLAIRIPDDSALLELLQQTGPLLTSSANQPGQPPATTISEAKAYFGSQVDYYEDAGAVNRAPSTVVKVENDGIHVLRQGAVVFDDKGKKIR
ncbi:threonylcarbamoyl-AMP synthase [Candidatus Saccharibacteria bacterium RIFCSPHIGHO2_01_FULL_45_15]|nr:MAG: threonylcarbamoyl-AMP synthase [Candidatus Saccharibacteria bacterium RIFCSPHIGHO2_01_FULL_45_15]